MFSATKGGSPSGYQISRSVRLRSSASAYFNRTLTTPTNGKIWTWSAWAKLGAIGTREVLFSGASSTNVNYISIDNFTTANANFGLTYANSGTVVNVASANLLRDPSSWYHLIVVYDSTSATSTITGSSTDRVRLYINGVQVTSFSATTAPALNATLYINAANSHAIGRREGVNDQYFDGYLTEINFIDGQALTPLSFGETNPVTGVWQPKKYTGTYNTNGFYLNFSDNSAATAAAIGKDYSGNGNNWTPNNISVTAGVTYDSMLDVPTQWADGGNGRGNYAVLNPLDIAINTTGDGNLKLTNTSSSYGACRATIAVPTTGKWYWETVVTAQDTTAGSWFGVGMMIQSIALNAFVGTTTGVIFYGDRNDASSVISNGATNVYQGTAINFVTGDVLQCSYDADSGKFWFGKNNLWWDSSVGTTGDPSAGTNQTLTAASNTYFPFIQLRQGAGTNIANINFGQRPFAYTPPSGFKALNTLNLPTPTILKGNQYMDVSLWTGTGSAQSITNSGSMQPDFVWGKIRSGADYHVLANSVVGANKFLKSNTTDAETTNAQTITAFNSNGFSVGTSTDLNRNTFTFVGWQWKEGATQGFDIVTYTGNGGTQNISHNLGVAPRMMIVKSRSVAQRWTVYHASVSNAYLYLNETFAADTANAALRFGNNSAVVQPTLSVFTIGNSVDVNQNTTTYVAYLFSQIAGFSAFGSYTGNGSADGPFIFTGFRPRFILRKGTVTAGVNWSIIDTARSPSNVSTAGLLPNTSGAEASLGDIDITSNGFKCRSSSFNDSGEVYIYAAFAENPFKNALAR